MSNICYPTSAYIHIPFCNSKCFYCAFTSTCNIKHETGYLISLLKDIDVNYQKNILNTLYFGGGTPSVLPIEHVNKILNKFILNKDAEITFEINPESSNYNYLKELKNIGINRISIGIQTFNDNILKDIGRKHTSIQALDAVENAKIAGFQNISTDLIYGLPNQTMDIFENDLMILKNLNVQHISLYGLKIEENTVFGKKNPTNLPDDDMQADMYEKACKVLENFYHYEISNFAINENFVSNHNINYWKNKEYYGFGCSAHGYENGIRYANTFDINKYIENPLLRDFGHTETEQEKLQEEIFLGLRLSEGICTNDINNKYNIDFEKKYFQILQKYTKSGHIEITPKGYRLSNKGFLISNIILADFI
ncbi:radical SAM family heme chaperone HemW [bacterium]|nr:radical SAM family heme chaperone HemW [bacterium]